MPNLKDSEFEAWAIIDEDGEILSSGLEDALAIFIIKKEASDKIKPENSSHIYDTTQCHVVAVRVRFL